jgi:hypothetical protein
MLSIMFLLTRFGAEWCCCLVPLPCCCLVPLPLLLQILGFPLLRLMFLRAGSEGSFGESTRTYSRHYSPRHYSPRHYSRRTVRELVRYLAASVNSDCCRRWSSPPPSPSTFHFRLRQAGVLGGGGGCEQFLGAMWVD